MSAIAAIFNRDGPPVARETLLQMSTARPGRGPEGHNTWRNGCVGMAHQHFWITPEEWGETQPLSDGDYAISCDVRLDNRQQLAVALQLDASQVKNYSDAAFILLCYRKWGVNCLTHLLGDFAFVIWDARQQRLFFARDALGARDICYYLDNHICLVASEISQLLVHPTVPVKINERRVAAFLANLLDTPAETFYSEIQYLPPAHAMVVSREEARIWRHWDVDPEVATARCNTFLVLPRQTHHPLSARSPPNRGPARGA